jgi:riboflavin kinase/FMN adenylyltransferase
VSLIRDLDELKEPLVNPVLTIGNFDGVHRGHLALFEKVKERARALGGKSAVMTFEPHPITVMHPGNGPTLITPTSLKLKLLDAAGIDVILCIPFTKDFAAISATAFVHDILVRRIGVKEIVVGYDYNFGHRREGDIHLLRRMGQTLGFIVHVMGPIKVGETLVSSTSIRNLIREGKIDLARDLLGRPPQLSGRVVPGQNRGGRLLGFPTANLMTRDALIPRVGVYAVEVLVGDQKYRGVTNVGYNPTFGDGPMTVETHLLGFSGDLVGREITLMFLGRIRDERRFGSLEALVEQIRMDIQEAEAFFSEEALAA